MSEQNVTSPRSFASPSLMPSRQRKFEHWLKAYNQYTSDSEAPEPLHFWTGVSTIAGALRRRVWIEQRKFQWTPNFYIVLVGPAGVVTKSTSVRIGTHLLRKVPNIHFGPNSLTWQALVKSLSEAQELIPYGKDQTGENVYLPMACITCSINELGTFLQPSELKLVDVFTDLWDGQKESWSHKTITQGDTAIENPWLNVIAATTPAWLRSNFPETMVGGGLTSRIIFVFADEKRQLVPYPGLLSTDESYARMEDDLVHDLIQISELIGEYALTPDAVEWGVSWYNRHWTERPEHLSSERFGGYVARKQTHIHKLAIVLAAAQRNELYITADDLQAADHYVTQLEYDMIQVFESIGAAQASQHMTEILSHLQVHRSLSHQELWRKSCRIMSGPEFREAIDGAVRAGYLTIRNTGKDLIYSIVADSTKSR